MKSAFRAIVALACLSTSVAFASTTEKVLTANLGPRAGRDAQGNVCDFEVSDPRADALLVQTTFRVGMELEMRGMTLDPFNYEAWSVDRDAGAITYHQSMENGTVVMFYDTATLKLKSFFWDSLARACILD